MLEQAKTLIREEAFLHKLEVVAEKEINYGVQMLLCNVNSSFDDSLPVNVYYSKKKGISIVVGGSQKSPFRVDVLNLVEKVKMASYQGFQSRSITSNTVSQKKKNTQNLHSWSKWIGTDESGKGDFFGPLVAAGFCCDETIKDDLLQTGVMDSKLLKSNQIIKIAHRLYAKYRRRIETVILVPETYNKLYADFSGSGKKLNELMAWMHSRIILNLAQKFPVEGALIDKFTDDWKVKASLKDMQQITLIQFPRAEQDMAVAAASIIARYHFLQGLDSLSKRYGVHFPKGASKSVVNTGKEFMEKYSESQLKKVCKTHFKTYQYVTGKQ